MAVKAANAPGSQVSRGISLTRADSTSGWGQKTVAGTVRTTAGANTAPSTTASTP